MKSLKLEFLDMEVLQKPSELIKAGDVVKANLRCRANDDFRNMKLRFEIVASDNTLTGTMFLADKIGFYDIYDLVAGAVQAVPFVKDPTLEQILEADRLARLSVKQF